MAATTHRRRIEAPGQYLYCYSVKAAFNPASITSPNVNSTTLTVLGAAVGDFVLVSPKTSVPAGGSIFAWVSAADEVTIQFQGIVGTVDFAQQDFRVLVIKAT